MPNTRVFPPWNQNAPKYLIASGKIRDRNQVLAVVSIFICVSFYFRGELAILSALV
jgi:hypothetical protein